ncbi:MAG: hypothetical protein PHD95_05990 [Candidatus ainarchaeum sp.]|nr:hypothetical protein [Candidatus ainarchaeum sp.]
MQSLDKAREVITKQSCVEGNLRAFAEAFLAKTLTGDGSISFTKNKKGHFRVQGYISDKNKEYREDYRRILKLFCVAVANWDDGQRVYFKCSEKTLRFFVRIGAFKGTRNWKKLLRGIILKQETNGSYRRFKEIQKQEPITHKAFADLFGVKIAAAKNWLSGKKKQGYFLLVSNNNKEYKYLLSRKAQELLHFIDFCKNELERENNVIQCQERNFRASAL